LRAARWHPCVCRGAGAWKRSILMGLKLSDKVVEKSVARLIKRKLIKQAR